MARSIDEQLGRWVGAWVAAVLRRPRLVAIGLALASLGAAPFVAGSLGLNSDEEALFAGNAAYAAARADFRRAFPVLDDAVVVLLDGARASRVEEATAELAAKLALEPEFFPAVARPDGGAFFDRHGLLYLDPDELGDVLDRLVDAQPYIGTLAADPTLRGLFGLLTEAADEAAGGGLERLGLEVAFDGVRTTLEERARGDARPLDWRELLQGPGTTDDSRQRVLLVEPILDFGSLDPAGATLSRLRELIRESGYESGGYPSGDDVRVRLTGGHALAQEEAELVATQATAAGVVALCVVIGVLFAGLRSGRAVAALIATLLVGLLWTAAFAAVGVGHLNLLSVAFAVLFIGLSVDFGIHVCVRVEELCADAALGDAVVSAARDVGGSLVVCALTTATGFYAFLGTDFLGVAELGLIAGTGMIIGLATNLTLLPALLVLWPPRFRRTSPRKERGGWAGLSRLPLAYPSAVLGVTALVVAGAALLAPRAHFDWNPLRVRDPSASSVQALEALLAEGRAHPWNLNVLAADPEQARRRAVRLQALPSVDEAVALDDFVPDDQQEKLAWIDDVAFLLLPSLEIRRQEQAPAADEQRNAVAELRVATAELAEVAVEPLARASRELAFALASLEDRLETDPAPGQILEELGRDLLDSLPFELDRLQRLLEPGPIRVETLSEEIRSQWIAADGRARIELFPSEDLGDVAALERYVSDVRAVSPGAYGEGLVIYEVGRTVVQAFQQALSLGALLIFTLIVALWRNLRDTLLAVVPITLAALLTVAGTVVLGMPFNFANVIVIPLLVGMGVDSSIHLIHRVRSGRLQSGDLLHTSTSRAVLLSALTTLASFGALGFSTHRGMGSLGRLLTLGIGLILVCNLVVLTALVRLLVGRRSRAGGGPSS